MKGTEISKDSKGKEKSLVREIFDWIVCIVVAFTLAVIIKYFVFTPTLVKQSSMTPTILDGERVLINRMYRTLHLPIYRGDIVTFEEPAATDDNCAVYNEPKTAVEFLVHNVLEIGKRSFIKRVIAVGGDHVKIVKGKVYVNDELQEEVYLHDVSTPQRGNNLDDVIVPEGYVYVMGDNRIGSHDSRDFGCIPIDKIEGRVKYRVWPLNALGKIDK